MNEWELRVDKVLHGNVHSFIFGGMPANWGVAINAIQENPNCAPEQRWWLEVIQDVIYGIASGQHPQYQFCRNPRYDATLDAAYERFNLARNEAVQGIVIGCVYQAGVNLADTLAVLDVLALPENYEKLPKSQAFVEAQGAAQARKRKIDAMTSNGAKNFSIRTGNNNWTRHDTQGFELQASSGGGIRRAGKGFVGMTDEEIGEMYTKWAREQSMKNMSVEELKEVVRTGVQQQFVDRYKINPNTGMPVAHEAPVEILYDPRDGSPITTRKELIRYINSSSDASKRLLTQNGKSVPSKIRAFEALLNSR